MSNSRHVVLHIFLLNNFNFPGVGLALYIGASLFFYLFAISFLLRDTKVEEYR
jgi:hypothetical protein